MSIATSKNPSVENTICISSFSSYVYMYIYVCKIKCV